MKNKTCLDIQRLKKPLSIAVFDFGSYKLVYDGFAYDVFVKENGKFYDVGIGFQSFDKARELAKRELQNMK